jgi:hypothetical protein
MSCVVGKLDGKGGVVMGADSVGVNSSKDLQLRADPKIFISGSYLIGVVGSWEANQVIRYKLIFPEPTGDDLFKHMVTQFLPVLTNSHIEKSYELLVGVRGRLFHIYGDKQVSEEIANYEAAGCAAQISRGALYAMEQTDVDPKAQVIIALEAAERFCSDIRRPFIIRNSI